MKKILFWFLVLIAVAFVGAVLEVIKKNAKIATNFNECVLAGHPVMESYPRQCRANNNQCPKSILQSGANLKG